LKFFRGANKFPDGTGQKIIITSENQINVSIWGGDKSRKGNGGVEYFSIQT
jgi:hypothetical protein